MKDTLQARPAQTCIAEAGAGATRWRLVEDAEVARKAYDLVKRIGGVRKIDKRLISGHPMGWD